MSIITEIQAKERCQKYKLRFGGIAVNGNRTSCLVYLICNECKNLILYSYAELNKRKTCLCKDCLANSYRLSKDTIEKRLIEFGASLVDISQYKVSTDIVDIKCKCGHIFKLRINDIPKHKEICCKKCKGLSTSSDIEEFCSTNKINLIQIKQNNKIQIECSVCKSKIYKTFNGLKIQKSPELCQKCSNSIREPNYNDINEMKAWFESHGLTADLSNYMGAAYKIPIICSCGHQFKRSWNSISYYKSVLCQRCTKKQNYIERKLEDAITDFGEEYEINYRGIISPQEIDFYFPKQKLGIEINGSYWHSDILKDRNYHLDKTIKAEKSGVQLIHFFDYEVLHKLNIIKSMIGARLDKAKKIYARQCAVQVIDKTRANNFFKETHIQGPCGALLYYGLILDDELLACMSFGKPRFNKAYEYELIRFSNRLGYTVVGGASKLFKAFVEDNNPTAILSYANRRFSVGGLYNKLGFSLIGNSKPSYFYSNGKYCISRIKAQKHKLMTLLGDKYNPSLSEYENMLKAKYFRIWDCGNLVYNWRKYD